LRFALSPLPAVFALIACAIGAAAAPVIDTVAQDETQLLVMGNGFGATQGTSRVLFDFVPLSVDAWSATAITVTVAPTFRAGSHFVAVQIGGEFSNPVNVPLRPVISSLSPPFGTVGQDVTAEGAFFGDDPAGDDAVFFGGQNGLPLIPPGSRWGPSSITFTVPDTRAEITTVTVRVNGLQSTGAVAFELRPSVIGLAPSSARVRDLVTITGTGFGTAPAPSDTVFLNGVPITTFATWDAHMIGVRVPRGACTGGQTKLVIGGIFEVVPAVPFALLAPHALADPSVSGGTTSGDVDAFGDGDTLSVLLVADEGLLAEFRLDPDLGAGLPLAVTESPPGSYRASFVIDASAGGYPGDGDYTLHVSLSNECPGGIVATTAPRTIVLDTVAPAITLVRRDNDPPPGQGGFYDAGDTLELFVQGENGIADFSLVRDAFVVPLGTAVGSGGDHVLSVAVPPGLSGSWNILAGLSDLAGNRTEVLDADEEDVVRIANGVVPPFERTLLTTPPHELADAIGPGEAVRFRLGSSSPALQAARVELTPVGQSTPTATFDLPAVAPDGGAGEVRAFEALVDGAEIPEGTYAVDYRACTSPTLPVDCTIGEGCNCLRLQDRVLVVDRSLPNVVLTLTREGLPTHDGCEPLVVGAGDTLVVHLTPDVPEPRLSARWDVSTAGVGPRDLVPSGTDLEDRYGVQPNATPGEHTMRVRISDGVNVLDPAVSSALAFDHVAPDGPSLTITSTSGAFPASIGDTVRVRASAEAGLAAFASIEALVSDAPMTEGPSGTYTFEWPVPGDLTDLETTRAVSALVSDCAHDSPPASGSIRLNTQVPVIESVETGGGDCQALDALVRIVVTGSEEAHVAEALILSTQGDSVTTRPILLEGEGGTYTAGYALTAEDRTRIEALQNQGRRNFVVRASLTRGALASVPRASSPFEFRDAAAHAVAVTAIDSLGVPIGDRLVVRVPSFTLSGTKTRGEAVLARAPGEAEKLLVPATNDTSWAAAIDLTDFGWSQGEVSTPISLFAEACGLPGPARDYTVVFDLVPPTLGFVELRQSGAVVTADNLREGEDLSIRVTGSDDQGAPFGLVRYAVGETAGAVGPPRRLILAPAEGGGFEGTIPGASLGPESLVFEVFISDGANAVSDGPLRPSLRLNALSSNRPGSIFEIGESGGGIVAERWHLLSVPATLDEPSSVRIFGQEGLGDPSQSTWRLLRWRSFEDGVAGAYVSSETSSPVDFRPGESVWFQWRNASHPPAFNFRSGRSTPLFTFSLELVEGWNQVATPFAFPVAWPAGAPELRAYVPSAEAYTPEGEGERVLRPFSGYFVLAPQAMTIVLDPAAPLPVGPSPTHPASFREVPGAWAMQVRFETSAGWDPFNYVGVHPGANDGADALDLLEAPVIEGLPHLTVRRSGDGASRDGDVRAPLGDEVARWEISLESERSEIGARVAWRWVETVPQDVFLAVVDPAESRVVDPRSEEEIRVDLLGGQRYPLVLLAGPRERVLAVAGSEIPAPPPVFSVERPYPNPFEDGVRLSYAMARAGQTEVRVYDPRGRLVAERKLPERAPGMYSFVWDGRDQRGRASAPGVYFLEIESGESRASVRVVRSAPSFAGR